MDIFLYFAFGALNICLLYLFIICYRRHTGINLSSDNNVDNYINNAAYFLSGPFGTIILIILGLFLYGIYRKYYRENKK